MTDILEHFALEGCSPRPGQELVLPAIVKAWETKDTVILEAPVGSGKSGVAMTLAKWAGRSHILTPRKSLQDQYYNDFPHMSCTVKGKGGYPCLPRLGILGSVGGSEPNYEFDFPGTDDNRKPYAAIKKDILKRIPVFHKPEVGCHEGPCEGNSLKKINCTMDGDRECPYNIAINTAHASPHIIHNIHSFFYQNKYSKMPYDKRDVIIIDECHDLETIVRGFLQTKITVFNSDLVVGTPNRAADIEEWIGWFLSTRGLTYEGLFNAYLRDHPLQEGESPSFETIISGYYKSIGMWTREEHSNGREVTKSTPERIFAENLIKALDIYSGMDPKEYIVATVDNKEKKQKEFTFTPLTLRGRPESLYLSNGEKRLLMSGTIYNKTAYCRNIGLNPEEVEFITLKSEFPADRRPIYAYGELMTDNSFASWKKDDTEFDKMITNIKKIMDVYKDKKGLIHAPSYYVGEQIAAALNSDRVITHTSDNFLSILDYFCEEEEGNDILISPTCQQGVDFKDGIARFQMILRVPYLSTSDDFVDHMRENNFMWYNYQSLIIFGQMIGRVMRSADDWGHTYLLDSRFKPYLQRNRDVLQPWLLEAVQYR